MYYVGVEDRLITTQVIHGKTLLLESACVRTCLRNMIYPSYLMKQTEDTYIQILFSLTCIIRYRRLVRSNRALYRSCPKHSKMLVAKAIVQAIQQQEPPGRFIKLTKGDGNTSEHIWKPITYSQAVNKTSQALREKETASFKRSTNKNSALDIAKETTEIMNYGDEKQRDEGFTNLTDVAIGLATEAQIPSSTLSSSLGRTKTSHGGEQKKRKAQLIVRQSPWGNMGSPPTDNSTSTASAAATSLGSFDNNYFDKKAIVTPSITPYSQRGHINDSNKRVRLASIDPLPLPTQPLEARQSTLDRFLNSTGLFGRENPNFADSNVHANVIDNNSTSSEAAFPPNYQRGSSGLFSFSRSVPQQQQQQQQSSIFPPRGIMGRMTIEQLQTKQYCDPSRGITAASAVALNRSHEKEEMQEIPTANLLDDDSIAVPPPMKGLTSQVSEWLTSFFPTDSSPTADGSPRKKSPPIFNNNVDAAIPSPPGRIPTSMKGEPSLMRNISSTIIGLTESPSMFLTSLKSGMSSMFLPQFQNTQPSALSSSQQQEVYHRDHFGGNMWNSDSGQASKKRASLLDDIEDTPMEKQLRNAQLHGVEKRTSLLDDIEDTPMEKQLRNARLDGTPRHGSLLDNNTLSFTK